MAGETLNSAEALTRMFSLLLEALATRLELELLTVEERLETQGLQREVRQSPFGEPVQVFPCLDPLWEFVHDCREYAAWLRGVDEDSFDLT